MILSQCTNDNTMNPRFFCPLPDEPVGVLALPAAVVGIDMDIEIDIPRLDQAVEQR